MDGDPQMGIKLADTTMHSILDPFLCRSQEIQGNFGAIFQMNI